MMNTTHRQDLKGHYYFISHPIDMRWDEYRIENIEN